MRYDPKNDVKIDVNLKQTKINVLFSTAHYKLAWLAVMRDNI